MAEPFCGQIGTFAFNYPPYDWATCDGSLVPVMQYQALAAIIGPTFGGSWPNTFALPDLRGRAMSGPGVNTTTAPPYVAPYASVVGHEFNSIAPNMLPKHSHPVNATASPGDPVGALAPAGKLPAQGFYSLGTPATKSRNVYAPYVSDADVVAMNAATISLAGTAAPQPADLQVDNRQPYTPMNFCICTGGNWPEKP